MFRAHVLIVRRSKLYYTASGIIIPIGGRPVHRLREDIHTYIRIYICMYVCVHVCVYMYVCVYERMYVCTYVCMY